MSLFAVNVGSVEEISTKITSSTVAVIVDGTTAAAGGSQAWYVPWLSVGENAGSTPNLTVEVYDGTTSFYQVTGGFTWVAKAVTAKQGITFYDLYVPVNSKLRITSSDAAGKFDVTGLKARRLA